MLYLWAYRHPAVVLTSETKAWFSPVPGKVSLM